MSANRQHFYTLEEYFALERTGDGRYEYWQGEIVAMSGGSKEHGQISGNIYGELYNQLKGRNCRAYTSEIPIKTPALPPYRYPDVSVACDKPRFEKLAGIDLLTNPIVIIEVLSPHTEKVDRQDKFTAYKALDSLQEYLLVEQQSPHITHYIKDPAGLWQRSDTGDITATVTLATIGCTLALADVYDNIEFN